MFHVIRQKDLPPSPNRTIEFQGEAHGAGISFLLVDNEPGQGPGLHLHPYAETWVVRAGRALVTADEVEIEAGPGDVVVVEPNTPHCFRNLGPERLEIVCIHAAGRMITEWLNDSPTT
ncbi:MAG TPA: cupin domain-containing protein [Gaiellaceae bacterium]|jgi:mannose-6-phosphate isomerase-like protein (cupin superfamily)|nr:cupin domain-containing protein [Gaiellaceae bacterium]